ncbi:MAG TPA: L,D-transpeptidase family protein [Hyphomicrobiaceae bacterium]|jgi:hypothetical protein
MTAGAPPRARDARRRRVHIATLGLAVLALAGAPAAAQTRGAGATTVPGQKAAAPPPGPLLAVVSVARQRVSVYGQTGLVAQSAVSTGMPGFRTPTGVFSILQKRRYHESNVYSGAPMPYMQRLTWSGVALHAGVLPGYPASHGCIRLPHRFAVELWGMTRVGTRVVVAPDDPAVLPIEDARLPVPRFAPGPTGDEPLHDEAEARGPELTAAVGLKVTDAEDELASRGMRLLAPLQRVKAARAFAVRDVSDKAKAGKLAAGAAAAIAAEAGRGEAALRGAETALAAAVRRQEAAARAMAAASAGTPAAERAGDALAAAQEGLDEAQRAADAAWLTQAALRQEATEAEAAAAQAAEARREAEAVVKASERAAEPISIFVSRKAGRVFVRQAWAPIHDAPVRILDGPPLGTHVYVAMAASDNGAALRWLSVSFPSPAPAAQRPRERRGHPASVAAAAGHEHETAAGALARFELPEATRRFIADRLWAGATLIVSDYGASGETGAGTDFIVLTR